jgi:hypothetical protein
MASTESVITVRALAWRVVAHAGAAGRPLHAVPWGKTRIFKAGFFSIGNETMEDLPSGEMGNAREGRCTQSGCLKGYHTKPSAQ